jgi:uncharacterized protein YqfA (UPF0365 family)
VSLNDAIEKASADMDAAQARYSEHRRTDPVAAEQDAADYYAAQRRLRALETEADGY